MHPRGNGHDVVAPKGHNVYAVVSCSTCGAQWKVYHSKHGLKWVPLDRKAKGKCKGK